MAQLLTCPVPTKSFPGFCPQGIALLRTLNHKNQRRSFSSHQELYEQKITTPLLSMVCSITREFARFAPHYVTPPAKAVFDVSGDIGSSRTAASRLTHPAAIWVHREAEGARGACFYFHFTAREAVVLGGVYSPEPGELIGYRKLFEHSYREFEEILSDKRLKRVAGDLQGEKLKHMPKGFPVDHPAADLLRRKQWYVVAMLDMGLLSTSQLMPTLVSHFEAMAPLVKFLNRTLAQRPRPKKMPLRGF
jgi:uncharacterized protein (TIGR02453 family)